jgi:hypothetical protein
MNEDDKNLEALLSEPLPYLEDAGFTERVMTSLPPRRAPARGWILLGFGSLAAAAGAFFTFEAGSSVSILGGLVTVGLMTWAAVSTANAEG